MSKLIGGPERVGRDRVLQLISRFDLTLTRPQLEQVGVYLNLLMKWNAKINLTSIRDPEEAVRRHFGESLLLSKLLTLRGLHLDIGSGAGFPGLVLKIAFPALCLSLLEPVAKKRAFLKEVVSSCAMECVEVRRERLDELAATNVGPIFDSASARAVGHIGSLVSECVPLLKTGGKLCLWLSGAQVEDARHGSTDLCWDSAAKIPESRHSVILVGTRVR